MGKYCSSCRFQNNYGLCKEVCLDHEKWKPKEETQKAGGEQREGEKCDICMIREEHVCADACLKHNREHSKEDGTAAGAAHYLAAGNHQPIEVMQACMSAEEFQGFLRGNIIKYTMRLGQKGDKQADVKKITQYAHWLAMSLEGKTINPREDSI